MKNRILHKTIVVTMLLLFILVVFHPTAIGSTSLQSTKSLDTQTSVRTQCSVGGDSPTEQWNSTYGGGSNCQGSHVVQTDDDGFIIVGQTQAYGAGSYDIWLIKTNAESVQQWNRTFGGGNIDLGASVQPVTTGGYIIIGTTYSFGKGNGDVWLIRTDSTGQMTWNTTFGGIGADTGSSLQQTTDGGFILVGRTNSYGSGRTNAWVIKTDANGKETWNKTFGVSNKDASGTSIKQTNDGGYIITGSITIDLYPTLNVWLVKMDSNGNKQWENNFGDEFDEWGTCVQQTSDSGYIIAANRENNFWIIKTNSLGSEEWSKKYDHSGGIDISNSIEQTIEDGYIVTGYAYVTSLGDRIWLLKIDSDGNRQWDKDIGAASAHGYCVHQTHDEGFIVVGDILGAFKEVYLIKIAPEGLPRAPSISGEIQGKKGKAYEYTFNAVDPDGDQVYYSVDWGDDTTTTWYGPYPSGQDVKLSHTWTKKGTYVIIAEAKDTNDRIGLKGTLEVTMPKASVFLNHGFIIWSHHLCMVALLRVLDALEHHLSSFHIYMRNR